jgi:endonuclease/exonuclease/phosphatase family metal-dependent hydrolase
MPTVTVGTFNLNNLFSRFDFKASVSDAVVTAEETTVYSFSGGYTLRTYQGKLVKRKPEDETRTIADRILAMDLDVLAVQEVEDVDTLEEFARNELGGRYPHVSLIEGNDARLIDVGVLSKLPLGAVTSWRHSVHPSDPSQPVFSRDLQEVQVFDKNRKKVLFVLYNTHLKSHYVPWNAKNKAAEAKAADKRRTRQAEVISAIVRQRQMPNGHFVVVGDMNDSETSKCLAPFTKEPALGLVNGLVNAQETQKMKSDPAGNPTTTTWTHRFKESGKPAAYELYDQIWLSPSLAPKQQAAFIGRRKNLAGDASDHDPAWVELKL